MNLAWALALVCAFDLLGCRPRDVDDRWLEAMRDVAQNQI